MSHIVIVSYIAIVVVSIRQRNAGLVQLSTLIRPTSALERFSIQITVAVSAGALDFVDAAEFTFAVQNGSVPAKQTNV